MKNKDLSSGILCITIIFLSACGGDLSIGKISAEEFTIFDQTGTWKQTVHHETFTSETINNIQTEHEFTNDLSSQVTVMYKPDDDMTVNFCNSQGDIQAEEHLFGFADNPNENCEVVYRRISENHIKAEQTCENQEYTSIEFEKINDSGTFTSGELSYGYVKDDTLIANPGYTTNVCTSVDIGHTIATYSPQPNDENLENQDHYINKLTVEADYNGDKVIISFTFTGSTEIIKDGDYTPVEFLTGEKDNNEVAVTMTSSLFAEDGEDVGTVHATDGWVQNSLFQEEINLAVILFRVEIEDGDLFSGSIYIEDNF